MAAVSGCEKQSESGAVDVVRGYVSDVQAGRFQSAYARTSARYRASIAEDEFARLVGEVVYLKEATEFRPEKVERLREGFRVEGSLVTGGGEIPCTAILLADGDRFQLDELSAPAERLMPLATGRADPAGGSGSR